MTDLFWYKFIGNLRLAYINIVQVNSYTAVNVLKLESHLYFSCYNNFLVNCHHVKHFGKGPLHNYVTPKSAVFYPPTHHVTIINL